MLVVPTSYSSWDIVTETDAEDFVLSQFVLSWESLKATTITLHTHDGENEKTLTLSNQNPFRQVSLLQDQIKKFVQDRDKDA